MPVRRSFGWSAAAGLLCVALSACGSTVAVRGGQVSEFGALGTNGRADLVPSGDAAQGISGVASAQPGSPGHSAGSTTVPAGSGGGVAPTTGANNGAGGPQAGGTTGLGSPGGRGTDAQSAAFSPKTFKIGMQYTTNGGAAVAATSGGSFKGDGRDAYDAVLGWINKNGGIAGRPAVASYNNIDSTASPSSQSEAACAQWTQDDHVALAIPTSAVTDMDLIRQCLKQAKVPALMGYVASRTLKSSFAASPLWFENGSLALEDYAQTYVQGLAQQGFFKGGKVGVVYYDKAPFTTALNSALLPALSAAGVSNPEKFGASIDGASTLGSGSQEMSSAVLSFRSKGVDRVLFFEPWIGYFAFLNSAKSQDYHPIYGLSSQEGPQLAADLGFAPADQLVGARIVTWNPMTDIKGYQPYTGPRVTLCNQILAGAGVSKASDQTGYWGQLLACENLLLVQDAYKNGPRQLAPEDFARGMTGLGSGLQPATRMNGSIGSTKHWATSKYWVGHFDSSKATFVLDGPAKDVQ